MSETTIFSQISNSSSIALYFEDLYMYIENISVVLEVLAGIYLSFFALFNIRTLLAKYSNFEKVMIILLSTIIQIIFIYLIIYKISPVINFLLTLGVLIGGLYISKFYASDKISLYLMALPITNLIRSSNISLEIKWRLLHCLVSHILLLVYALKEEKFDSTIDRMQGEQYYKNIKIFRKSFSDIKRLFMDPQILRYVDQKKIEFKYQSWLNLVGGINDFKNLLKIFMRDSPIETNEV